MTTTSTPTPSSQQRVREIIGSLENIATLPEITARITATVNNPKSSAAELHRLIAHDPALVARILKLVNSSLYARTTHVDSVQRAIVLLGFKAVHHLALAATLGDLFTNARLCRGFGAKDLWKHCIAVGVIGRKIALAWRPAIAEEAFLAGLVHDVGLLAALQSCPDQLQEVCAQARDSETPFGTLESGIVGADHCEVGAALAAKWGFPQACRVIAATHHAPADAPENFRALAAVVHAADTLACQQRVGFYLTAVTQTSEQTPTAQVIPAEVLQNLRENIAQIVGEAMGIFN